MAGFQVSIYEYFDKKAVIPVIPLAENSQKITPHLPGSPIQLDKYGTPLCPAGMRMRHHVYDKNKAEHALIRYLEAAKRLSEDTLFFSLYLIL